MPSTRTVPDPPKVSHEDLADRLASGETRFRTIETKLDDLILSVKTLAETVEPVVSDISTIKEITSGWRALGTIASFVKWASGLVAAFGVLWVAMKAAAKGWI